MKIPLSWLREYVDIDVEPKALAERLTFAGLEVESVDVIGSAFKGIVAGEVLSVKPHPNATLLVCQVSNGQKTFQVVCGARNFGVGDKVPLAEAGTSLPNGTLIQTAVLHGEPSQGMLCAEDELGLSLAELGQADDHTGVLILPRDVVAGTPLSKILGPPETVLTIEVTPNRPDCLSVIGVAREVAALYGCRLKFPAVSFPEKGTPVDRCTSVRVEDAKACPRYTARILSNVTIAPIPFPARRRLTLSGIRPINNIVDVTNYVMLECGHPLHAFDQTLLEEGRIVVRRAKPDERMATLDGTERVLTPDLLVIADARNPVAVAGIMGGAASGILDTTRTVLLESAYFKPAVVRKGSKLLGLSTESSYRFERGADINRVEWASRRAASLMIQWAGAIAAKGVIDVFPTKPKPRKIVCRFDRVRSLLGVDMADPRITAIFKSLTLPVVKRTQKGCTVQAPTFRPDLETEADLIEEVARIYGLDKIPMPSPRAQIVPGADDRPIQAVIQCRHHLIGLGLSEIVNYSFVSDTLLNRFEPGDASRRVILPRPISADHSILRPSLVPQMVETLGRNRSRQIAEAAFFEIGRVFFSTLGGSVSPLRHSAARGQAGGKTDPTTPAEEERLSIGLMGPVGRSGLEKHRPITDDEPFTWLKGILEALCRALSFPTESPRQAVSTPPVCPPSPSRPGLPELGQGSPAKASFPIACFKAHRVTWLALDGEVCGVLGLIADEIRQEYRLLEPVAVLELRLAPLLRHVEETPSAERLPVYPSVTRDIALRVGDAVKHEAIVRTIWKVAPKELTEIRLFDIYKSVEFGVGCKSMAYSLTYCSPDRTLTDDEVNGLHEAIKARLRSELKAEIREG